MRRGSDDRALDRYSRLKKAKEWVESELGRRYFIMEGARLLLAERLDVRPGEIVLDLGSGDDWFSIQATFASSTSTAGFSSLADSLG